MEFYKNGCYENSPWMHRTLHWTFGNRWYVWSLSYYKSLLKNSITPTSFMIRGGHTWIQKFSKSKARIWNNAFLLCVLLKWTIISLIQWCDLQTFKHKNQCWRKQQFWKAKHFGNKCNYALDASNTTSSQLTFIYWNKFYGGPLCNFLTQANSRFLTLNQ